MEQRGKCFNSIFIEFLKESFSDIFISGTGAAPQEFSDRLGLPLEEGLVTVRNLLMGSGLMDKVKIIASGKVSNGFSLVKNPALGADICNSARGFMLSLGCIPSPQM